MYFAIRLITCFFNTINEFMVYDVDYKYRTSYQGCANDLNQVTE